MPNTLPSEAKFNLAVLASGGGSNADKICSYFHTHPTIRVAMIISNRRQAGVFDVAAKHHIPAEYIPKSQWEDSDAVLPLFQNNHITHIILAGFLLHIPEWLIKAYPKKIINIHPALLPRYGGKGMYGHHVHEAVKAAGDLISGITIHEVNEYYDEGRIIFQKEVSLDPEDSAKEIGAKVLKAEHAHYPTVIEKWIQDQDR